jgi:hypothetical protein
MTTGQVDVGHVDGDAERVAALVAVAGHRTVHNTLTNPPEVTVTVT